MEPKRCKKCKKLLKTYSISDFCSNCGGYERAKRYRERKKKKGICIDCTEKVNPVIIFPNGLKGPKIVKYFIRCYDCRNKRKDYRCNS